MSRVEGRGSRLRRALCFRAFLSVVFVVLFRFFCVHVPGTLLYICKIYCIVAHRNIRYMVFYKIKLTVSRESEEDRNNRERAGPVLPLACSLDL